MNPGEKIILEKFVRSLKACELHISRLNYAISGIETIFPITEDSFNNLNELEIQAIDQFLFRFTKLQDELGGKTFKFLLLALKEDIEGKPFLEILARLEQLRILRNEDTWMTFRELRNELAHEYPEMMMDNILGLNSLYTHIPEMINIYERIRELAQKYKLINSTF